MFLREFPLPLRDFIILILILMLSMFIFLRNKVPQKIRVLCLTLHPAESHLIVACRTTLFLITSQTAHISPLKFNYFNFSLNKAIISYQIPYTGPPFPKSLFLRPVLCSFLFSPFSLGS